MTDLTPEQKKYLPPGQNTSQYSRLKVGVYDDRDTSVWLNEKRDFAFLFPQPAIDYEHYKSRRATLGLQRYQQRERIVIDRLGKLLSHIPCAGGFLEVGASSGEFLKELGKLRPGLDLYAVEPDQTTLIDRSEGGDILCFSSLGELASTLEGRKFDAIGLFHVFEHIRDPLGFCSELRDLTRSDGKIIIEVPSLDDPLLSIYQSDDYQEFYFQLQHPFVYSPSALKRTLEACSLEVLNLIQYQRYGLENHLAWLTNGRPGGDFEKFGFLNTLEQEYRSALEQAGKTDTVIAICRPSREFG